MNAISSLRPVYQMPPGVYALRRSLSAFRTPDYDAELWRMDQRLLTNLEGILADLRAYGDAQALETLTISEIWELPLAFTQRMRLLELLWRVGH